MNNQAPRSHCSNVPKLRFPDFVGEWKIKKLGELGDVVSGLTYNPSNVVEDGTLVLRSSNIKDGRLTFTDNVFVNLDSSSYNPVKPNDILICVRNGSKRLIGKNALIDDYHKDVAFGAFMSVFRSDINPYLFHLFSTDIYKKEIHKNLGATINSINGSDLKKFKMPIPPTIEELNQITSFLDVVNLLIDNLRSQQVSLELYKKSIMQKIFSQEIRFKDENGRNYPEWGNKALSEIAEINPSSSKLPEEFTYIDLESVEKGVLKHKYMILKNQAPSRAQRVLDTNDILFQTVRPYQQNNLFITKNENYVASTGYAQIRTSQNPLFLYQYLHSFSFLNKVLIRCTGSSYPAINSNDLKSIKVNVPSINEQSKIANFLTSIDKSIESKQNQINDVQTWKNGLMQRLFI